MVRSSMASVLALAFLSCSGAPLAVRDVEPYGAFLESEDAAAVEVFETVERLRENPVDPRRALVEDLVSIPGFPEPLAEKIALAVREHRSGTGWIDALTPPERSLLYRFSDVLVLPERPSAVARARITERGAESDGRRRSDARVALAGDGWQVVARSRDYDLRRRGSFYASAAERSGTLRFHCGGLTSDIAMGLVFGGGSSAVSSSGAFPLWSSRWIAGNTSFYGRSLWGGAAELWYRSARAALVVGQPRSFRGDRFECEANLVRIARLELRRGSSTVGASAVDEGSRVGAARYSISGTVAAGGLRAGFEAAGDGSGEAAYAWGFSYRGGKTKSAVRFHAIPAGASGRWSAIDGRAVAPAVSDAGVTAVVDRIVRAGFRVRASIERSARADGFDDETSTAVRAECERRGRRARVRVTWSSRTEGGTSLIPWPGDERAEYDRDRVVSILTEAEACPWLAGKISARYAEGEGHSGVLVSPSLTCDLMSGRLRLLGTVTSYRSLRGRQAHYFYEPSLEGMFPWVAASGSGTRASIRIVFKHNEICVMSKVVREAERWSEIALQAAIELR